MHFLILLCAGCALSVDAVPVLAAGITNESQSSGAAQASVAPLGLRELPADQYGNLRTQTLARAKETLGPKSKNPRISAGGMDPAILGVLADQRAYLGAHRLLMQPTTLMAGGAPLPDHEINAPTSSRKPESGPLLRPNPSTGHSASLLGAPCTGPTIHLVNGRAAGAVFTPQPPDNHIRIEGCSFGSLPGTVKLQTDTHGLLIGTQNQSISLLLDSASSWSEDEIDVHLDTSLTGISDFAATLVIRSATGRETQLSGCLFVAARGEPQLLRTIPAAWVKLDATIASLHPIRQLEYVSPPVRSQEIPHDATGTSVFIVRSDSEVFGAGADTYDFAQLNPGWVVESVQLEEYDVSCPGDVTLAESKGSWSTLWNPHGFTIQWARDACASYIPPVFSFNLNSSQYAVRVWVIGPAGTQPMRMGL
jgi:hypothetical protein